MPRSYPDRPYVGVGAVVWHGERFLLVRRSKPPRQGQWSIPGGLQELGETVHEAVRREIAEETALDVVVTDLLDSIDIIERDDDGAVRTHYTLIDVAAEAGHDKARAGDDAAAVGWFTLDDLGGLGLWDETVRIIKLAAKRRKER